MFFCREKHRFNPPIRMVGGVFVDVLFWTWKMCRSYPKKLTLPEANGWNLQSSPIWKGKSCLICLHLASANLGWQIAEIHPTANSHGFLNFQSAVTLLTKTNPKHVRCADLAGTNRIRGILTSTKNPKSGGKSWKVLVAHPPGGSIQIRQHLETRPEKGN